ncbi:hypothetical protein AURDEDRAFT_166159 [Auricularia subglabra TFB-10046 SS5]|nr:hypothetical protein AURDEDRAFT_166159 [Auricularia subglabra TFB-10046 SS5]
MRYLSVRLSRKGLVAAAAARLRLPQLDTLRADVCNPTPRLLASFLSKFPRLRTLRLGIIGSVMHQDEEAPLPLLPLLVSYSQETILDLYRAPLFAAARTLRELSISVEQTLPDMSRLTSLSRLTVNFIGYGPTTLDDAFCSTLTGCRSLRHLVIEYATHSEDNVFGNLAALMPQLYTLLIRVHVSAWQTCSELAEKLLEVLAIRCSQRLGGDPQSLFVPLPESLVEVSISGITGLRNSQFDPDGAWASHRFRRLEISRVEETSAVLEQFDRAMRPPEPEWSLDILVDRYVSYVLRTPAAETRIVGPRSTPSIGRRVFADLRMSPYNLRRLSKLSIPLHYFDDCVRSNIELPALTDFSLTVLPERALDPDVPPSTISLQGMVFGFGGPSIDQVAQSLAANPGLAQTVVRLKLQGSSGGLGINDGPSLVEIIGACSNVEHLQFRVTRAALDQLVASQLCLDRLHTLRMEYCDPDPNAVARLLLKMPNICTLSLGTLGVDMREHDALLQSVRRAECALLPHLVSYSQTTILDLYRVPMFSAATRLRSLTVYVFHTLPDLSYLTALTGLHVKITGRGPTALDPGFHDGLLGCRRLRQLQVTCVDIADETLFVAVAALGPRLSALTIHVVGNTSRAGEALAAQLAPLIRGPLVRLRSLDIQVEFIGDASMARLRGALGDACRARRVHFLLKNYSYQPS